VTPRTNDVLVGLFVLLLGAALVAGILWFSAGRIGRGYDEYVVYMDESVIGLSRDSSVKYYGVDVGRVHRIELGPGYPRRVRLLLQLTRGTPVKKDTVASLEALGLTGLAFINLTGGGADAEPLEPPGPGEEFPVIRSEHSTWSGLEHKLFDLATHLNDAALRLNTLLGEENQVHIRNTLSRLETLIQQLARKRATLTSGIDDLASIAHDARNAASRLPGLVQTLNDAAASLNHMAQEFSATAVATRDTLSAGKQDVKRLIGEAAPELTGMIYEFRRAAENFRRFSEQLDRDPSVLLRGPAPGRPGPGE